MGGWIDRLDARKSEQTIVGTINSQKNEFSEVRVIVVVKVIVTVRVISVMKVTDAVFSLSHILMP